MTNQRKDYEGLTLSVECQVVEHKYHGVVIPSGGNGILGQMIAQARSTKVINSDPGSKTTANVVSIQIPIDDIDNSIAVKVKAFRGKEVILNSDIIGKVNLFHDKLNGFKKSILGNDTSKQIDQSTLDGLQEAMIPFNIGKVVCVKIQSRIFSKTDRPGFHKVKTGGFAISRVVFKYHIEYDNEDIQATAEQIAKSLADFNPGDRVIKEAGAATIERREDDSIVITPIPPVEKIQMDMNDGTKKAFDVEEILARNKSSAFSRGRSRSK